MNDLFYRAKAMWRTNIAILISFSFLELKKTTDFIEPSTIHTFLIIYPSVPAVHYQVAIFTSLSHGEAVQKRHLLVVLCSGRTTFVFHIHLLKPKDQVPVSS